MSKFNTQKPLKGGLQIYRKSLDESSNYIWTYISTTLILHKEEMMTKLK